MVFLTPIYLYTLYTIHPRVLLIVITKKPVVAGKLLKSGIRVKNRLIAGPILPIFSITSCPTCGFSLLRLV